MDTVFALSSGAPPAGIAVVRASGPQAGDALRALAGSVPPARTARLAALRDQDRALLDQALVLWFPGPNTATGEDLAEFHLHGGRAVVSAVQAALAALPGLRPATPGEFTRRAFANGRIDLAEAEGLADLLSAETELQRQAAIGLAGGALSRRVDGWRERLLVLSAQLEATLDFADESDAAITAPLAGTTRDVLERPVALGGKAFTFVDMAGLRLRGEDPIEAIGIERAGAEIARADIVLWLGPEGEGPEGSWEIEAQCDRHTHESDPGNSPEVHRKRSPRFRLSALTGENLPLLRQALVAEAAKLAPKPGETALNQRQRILITEAQQCLADAKSHRDPLLTAEALRRARVAFEQLTGRSSTEDVLDSLFGRFCIGK